MMSTVSINNRLVDVTYDDDFNIESIIGFWTELPETVSETELTEITRILKDD